MGVFCYGASSPDCPIESPAIGNVPVSYVPPIEITVNMVHEISYTYIGKHWTDGLPSWESLFGPIVPAPDMSKWFIKRDTTDDVVNKISDQMDLLEVQSVPDYVDLWGPPTWQDMQRDEMDSFNYNFKDWVNRGRASYYDTSAHPVDESLPPLPEKVQKKLDTGKELDCLRASMTPVLLPTYDYILLYYPEECTYLRCVSTPHAVANLQIKLGTSLNRFTNPTWEE
ncbi:hypothetical protein VKT23_012311 [Stygiomarasmius scandens]|uniref:Uncharacterized protein n=1 Tax=Marasmiellus scandens TaxID=2682957 RepID=A0ABR1JB77_9AGAR